MRSRWLAGGLLLTVAAAAWGAGPGRRIRADQGELGHGAPRRRGRPVCDRPPATDRAGPAPAGLGRGPLPARALRGGPRTARRGAGRLVPGRGADSPCARKSTVAAREDPDRRRPLSPSAEQLSWRCRAAATRNPPWRARRSNASISIQGRRREHPRADPRVVAGFRRSRRRAASAVPPGRLGASRSNTSGERCRAATADDDRVWLGRANLAMLARVSSTRPGDGSTPASRSGPTIRRSGRPAWNWARVDARPRRVPAGAGAPAGELVHSIRKILRLRCLARRPDRRRCPRAPGITGPDGRGAGRYRGLGTAGRARR